jgi:hypothetical protein
MHAYLVLASVLLPLSGVFLMENGAFGNSIGMSGYSNGVSVAYAIYALVLLFAYFSVRLIPSGMPVKRHLQNDSFARYVQTIFIVYLVVLMVMLFGAGAWRVWVGQIGKGAFRATLGSFGAVAYLLTNSVIPLLTAYAAVLYKCHGRGWRDQWLLGMAFLAVLVIGSTWGFKSTGITMLLPALIVIFWGASSLRIFSAITLIMLVFIGGFYLFDQGTTEATEGPSLLFRRMTVLQSDVSWYLWNEHLSGAQFPSYFKTLMSFMGGRVFSFVSGITRETSDGWVLYHFDSLIGVLVGLPLSVIDEGHSIVGTPFADGLVMGGMPGVIIMALFAGGLAGLLCNMLERALRRGQLYRAAFIATYFGMFCITFLRNGAAVQLIHVSTIVGMLLALAVCAATDTLCRRRVVLLARSKRGNAHALDEN